MTPQNAGARREYEVIGLIGFAHGTSHFFHLLLPPLFPWLMKDFSLNFTEVGSLMTVFFVVSGIGQALAGFVVDKLGARRVLLGGIVMFVLAGAALAAAQGMGGLLLAATLAGLGNSVFHPADFTILNRRVSQPRLGHAFSVHGLSGNLGWAAAPVFLTSIAAVSHWRTAALAASAVAVAAFLVVLLRRDATEDLDAASHATRGAPASAFGFLGSGAVWMCFAFFFLVTTAFGALQNYATPVLQNVYGLSLPFAAASLTTFLLGGGMGIVTGGFLAGRSGSHDRLIAVALSGAALVAVLIASGGVPSWSVTALMGLMGFLGGIAGPSRDLLVRRAATARFGQAAFGRVYGFVYSGLDIGLAVSPLVFGPLMDAGRFGTVLIGVAVLQALAVPTALRVGQGARRAAPA